MAKGQGQGQGQEEPNPKETRDDQGRRVLEYRETEEQKRVKAAEDAALRGGKK